jgi:hypothetical protein
MPKRPLAPVARLGKPWLWPPAPVLVASSLPAPSLICTVVASVGAGVTSTSSWCVGPAPPSAAGAAAGIAQLQRKLVLQVARPAGVSVP